jgi:putative methyltransferase (TIGR04325 family)
MTVRNLAKELLPPIVARALRKKPPVLEPSDFSGDYASWAEAQRGCSGYETAIILEATRRAALKVSRGEALFERDSVAFSTLEHPFPLLAGLSRAAAIAGGRLSVLDFGGALGSTYFQTRKFLEGVRMLQWGVVEQAAHVACGQADLSSTELNFFTTPNACIRASNPNVLLLSSVLQYLPDPYLMFGELCALGIPNLILDRTAFIEGTQERLTIQTVPKWIYPASYPAWFFNEARLLEVLDKSGYRVLADFPCADHVALENERVYFRGFICTLR